jgi:hypothetical protein
MRISRAGALVLLHIFSPNHHSKTTTAQAFRFALWFRAEVDMRRRINRVCRRATR